MLNYFRSHFLWLFSFPYISDVTTAGPGSQDYKHGRQPETRMREDGSGKPNPSLPHAAVLCVLALDLVSAYSVLFRFRRVPHSVVSVGVACIPRGSSSPRLQFVIVPVPLIYLILCSGHCGIRSFLSLGAPNIFINFLFSTAFCFSLTNPVAT